MSTSLLDSRPTPPRDTQPPSIQIKTTTDTFQQQATRSQPQAASSIPSTPGFDIPGAYPREEKGLSAELSGSTAKQSAFDTTRSRLPAGLASYLPSARATSLPSTEKEGAKPGEHYDGVGPLPGSISETSVAKLPDERASATLDEQPKRDRPAHPLATRVAAASLPSQETAGVQPQEHHGGVGSLPGSGSETFVEKLPDERTGAIFGERFGDATEEGSQRPNSDTGPIRDVAPGFGGSGTKSQETEARKIDRQEDESVEKNLEQENQWTEMKKLGEAPGIADSKFKEDDLRKGGNSGGGEKKDELKGTNEVPCPSSEQHTRAPGLDTVQEGPRSLSPPETRATGGPAQRKGRSSSDSDASNHKKASVMNKVRGEMKVLLGKASRNREKVEEGERLKHGSQ
ncbi:hypothetical protein B0F90DRAFT_1667612 [Multifurca ochricompacta]|uniref:Uncharacterized protein n=1 Tax=Multifurca ochricompacta TaxID=376703 RepID=A0AAD4QLQ1_9AGAM|nr:hypothetical protein B0F90DRAFT_1667612 [Multifurca ochricompacta]